MQHPTQDCPNSTILENLLARENQRVDDSQTGAGMLVAIAPNVEAYQMLAAGVREGANVIILNPNQDSIEQITEAIARYSSTSLHLVCHGAPGQLDLGSTILNLQNLQQYSHLLQEWGLAEISLYACQVAAGDKTFIRRLQQLTGANIAASNQPVGSPAKGGTWQLEAIVGKTPTKLPFSQEVQQTYPGILPVQFNPSSDSPLAVGTSPALVLLTDLDADGDLDLETANNDGSTSALLNNGDGTFAPFEIFTFLEDIDEIADFNGDGNIDVVGVDSSSGDNSFGVLLSDGLGDFSFSRFGALLGGGGLEAGDIDGDGSLDVILGDNADNTLSVWLNNGDSTFASPTEFITLGSSFVQAPFVEDFDDDGDGDVLTVNSDGTASLLLSNGDGTLSAPMSLGVNNIATIPGSFDFNPDTNSDLLGVRNDGSIFALLNNGDGTFSAAQELPANTFIAADFNGDGNVDIITLNFEDETAAVELANGDGTFSAIALPIDPEVEDIFSGFDADEDGNIDVLTLNNDGTVSVLLGNGDGTFGEAMDFPVGAVPINLGFGDLDGDGDTDLAVADANDNNISVLINVPVDDVNTPPVAVDDSATTEENTALTIPTADLLANDSDADGDVLTVTEVGDAVNGIVELDGDDVIFTPDAGFAGEASFEYSIDDGNGETDTATVEVEVTLAPPFNNPPIAIDDNAATTINTLVEIDVLENDLDIDGDPLELSILVPASNGVAVVDDDDIDYTPDTDFIGTDTFTYQIDDGNGGIDTATVEVAIASAPPSGRNVIVGTRGDDNLPGTAEDDAILARSGDDLLRGGPGSDLLIGGAGSDTLIGGVGRDILIGGMGSDVFVLRSETAAPDAASADVILAFQVNLVDPSTPIDFIGLTGGLTEDDLTLELFNGNTAISITGSNRVLGIVTEATPEQLSDRFISVDDLF